MGSTFVIARREVSALFYSPVAYIVMFLFLLVTGFVFAARIFIPGQFADIRELIENCRFGLFFIVPGITMSLLSDEYRSGRIEMLRTSPIREIELVLGKYLGAMLFYACLMAVTLIYIALLLWFGKIDWGQTIAAYLGLLLLGMMFVSVGLFFSACTRDQILALFSTTLTLGFLTMASGLASLPIMPAKLFSIPIRAPLNYLGVYDHIADFARGKVDTEHLAYFLGISLLFLLLTYLVVESRKWR